MNAWFCRALGCVVFWLAMIGEFLPQRSSWAAAAKQSPPSSCRKVCKRVPLKHATRHCQHQWKCGLQQECQWVERVLIDATGERRKFRVRECRYVRRCFFEEQCQYQSWKLKCELRCESEGVLAPLQKLNTNASALVLGLAAQGDCSLHPQEKWLLAAVNQERHRQRLPELRCHMELLKAAREWSRMQCFRGELSHDRLAERLKEHKIETSLSAENVAAGQSSVARIFQQWMRSKKHRGFILHKQFTHVGGGLYLCGVSDHTHYWTQIFVSLRKR